MTSCIRVVECGGQGPRKVDVLDNTIIREEVRRWSELDGFKGLMSFAKADLSTEPEAIIFSVAGTVEDHKRIVKSPNTLIPDDTYLGKTETEIPYFACNDMESSSTGITELFPHLTRRMDITWSTGIGVRFCKDGQILSDSEAGHMKIDLSPFTPVCGCGQRGCAEAIISGNAIDRFVAGQVRLQGRGITGKTNLGAILDTAYNANENWAVRHYNEVIIQGMAVFLANIQTMMRLPAIVWKGSVAQNAFENIPTLEADIRSEMRARMFNHEWVDEMKFHFLTCPKDHDAYIGAAKIAHRLIQ